MSVSKPRDVAYWSSDSGAVWIEPADGRPTGRIADRVTGQLSAYEVLATAGFTRWTNWTIVPGIPGLRSAEVTRGEQL